MMKSRLLSAALILLFSLATGQLFAQSSIYQDAKSLSQFVKKGKPPILRYQPAAGSNGQAKILFFGKTNTDFVESSYRLPYFGEWHYEIKGGTAEDEILIQFYDTLLQINNVDSLQKVIIDYGTDSTRIRAGFTNTESRLAFFDYSDNNVSSQIKNAMYILGAHNDFDLMSDYDYRISFTRLMEDYATNPYMYQRFSNSQLIGSENYYDQWLQKAKFEAVTEFPAFYSNAYPWQQMLDGDSILQLENNVSFQDVTTNYRQQIVTSQKQLTEASSEINKTNERKGAIDARTVAVGLSDFIAERAQEELNLTFFNRFKENLSLDNPTELTKLFPDTRSLLYKFEITNYKTLLSHARESFTKDLKNLGVNFPKILDLPKYKELKNDPNVFNLSLIYRIADLAYKEYPIETILLSGHQMLQERNMDLDKSINLAIADSIFAEKNKTDASQILIRDAQKKLIDYANQYLEKVALADKKMTEILNGSIRNAEGTIYDIVQKEEYLTSEKREGNADPAILENLITMTNGLHYAKQTLSNSRRLLAVNNAKERGIIYNDRIIKYESPYNYYKKILPANLNGNQYYGYLLDNPRVEDFETYFQADPKAIAENLAQGIEECRSLLQQDFTSKLSALHEVVLAQEAKIALAARTLRSMNRPSDEKEKTIKRVAKQKYFLSKAIKKEIQLWEDITGLDQNDHYLAGLYFLDALLKNDEYVKLFQSVHQKLESGSASYNELILSDYSRSLKINFYPYLEAADARLDSVANDFNRHTQKLIAVYGDYSYDSTRYKLIHSMQDNETEIDQLYRRLDSMDVNFSERRRVIEEGLENELNEAPQVIELTATMAQLQGQIRTAENEEEKASINAQIDSLNEIRNGIIQNAEASVEEKLNQLLTEEDQAFEKINARIAELKSKNMSVDSIQVSSTSASINRPYKTFYQLEDNPYYGKYLSTKYSSDKENSYIERNITKYTQKVLDYSTYIDSAKMSADQLDRFLGTLSTTYCPELIKAKDNAKALAKSLELSTHLLFAFRNYEHTYDTLYYRDTVQVTVTINELDSITGLVNTFTEDTLKIIEKPIKGTTDPVLEARWLNREEFDALRKDEVQWDFFLGLLYQRMSSVNDAPGFSPQGIALLTTKFFNIANDVETNRRALRRKKATVPESVSFKDYYPFIRSTVDLFNTIITTQSIGESSLDEIYPALWKIPDISNEALSLYENIYVKNYANGVLNAMELLKLLKSDKLNKKQEAQSTRSINAVLTYGTFMANMIDAQTSEQVKTILRAATLPPGSSRIKREVVSNFTINSYLGATIGRDRLIDAPEDLQDNSFGAALSVPIGFTYSFSPNLIKNNSSFSLHVPLLDLGAITAYRQDPDNPNYSVESLPEFKWSNLFSPGLFLVYNFANSPFSLGVGGQYGPQLREIKVENADPIFLNSWRFPMVFFNIDVPFFNLHTGPRKIIVK